MKEILETIGTEFDATNLIEPVLLIDLNGDKLNENKEEDWKVWEIAKLLVVICASHKLNVYNPNDFVSAKIMLIESVRMN